MRAGEQTSPVSRSYLGLSTEYWSLPLYAHHVAALERVLSLLHVPGDGPLLLRVGGDSADRAFWDPRERRLPRWAFPVTPRWTRLVGAIVRGTGIRLILDLNLITGSPAAAAGWAKAARARLPRHAITSFEIGNEPDVYRHSAWIAQTADKLVGRRPLPSAITRTDYVRAFRRYARSLQAVAPGVPLLGPALANPRAHENWTAALIASREPALGALTAHRYVFSGCVRPTSRRFPTIARMLSRRATAGLATSVKPEVDAAHRAGLRFRLTELNSVNCGGRPGISNAFATALWAPSALFGLLAAGVDGVNIHVRADTINAPFAFGPAGLVARPLLYGLVMVARTLGRRPRLVPVTLRAGRSLHLEAWAVRSGADRLHVLLIDEGRRPVRVRLRLPGRGPAAVRRLLGPSPRALSGVTLDGQWLGRNGRWHGARADEIAVPGRRGYLVTVARYSAALVSVRVAGGVPASDSVRPARRRSRSGLSVARSSRPA